MIGILGGTFDPVHFGHLRPALEVREALALDEVRLIPCHLPPHRSQPQASHTQRAAMLRAAAAQYDGFVIDEREYRREGPSYTLDTLQSLQRDMPARTLCLLVGMDSFAGLTSWHRWRELIEHCHMVVMTRPGAALPAGGELADFIHAHRVVQAEQLCTRHHGLLYTQEVSQLDISATAIRTLLAQGGRPDYLLPLPVIDIIRREGLYIRGEA